jgi:addiction module HigA family antidote
MPKTSKSSTITDKPVEIVGTLAPLHPGEVLREEFLVPLSLSAYAVARACHIPRTRIERLAREETPVTADTAIRLARFFGTTPDFWMGLQTDHDLRSAIRGLRRDINKIVPLGRQAA